VRIGTRFLQPGIGWGRSCFAKDTTALISTAAEYRLNMPIVNAAREINRYQRSRVNGKLLTELKILKGSTTAKWGWPSCPIPMIFAMRLRLRLPAMLRTGRQSHSPRSCGALSRARCEPGNSGTAFCDNPEQIAKGADAVILVTEWSQDRGSALGTAGAGECETRWCWTAGISGSFTTHPCRLPLCRANRLTRLNPVEKGDDRPPQTATQPGREEQRHRRNLCLIDGPGICRNGR
jgi:hypothetical protein